MADAATQKIINDWNVAYLGYSAQILAKKVLPPIVGQTIGVGEVKVSSSTDLVMEIPRALRWCETYWLPRISVSSN